MNDRMGERCKIIDSTKRIVHNTNQGAYYRALSSDVKTKHGFVPFQDAPAPPDRPASDMTPINSYTPVRDQIRAGEQEFRAEMIEMFKED